MKNWILPSITAATVVFLMTRPGRELQEKISGHLGDWTASAQRSTQRVQETLGQVQDVLERCDRALRET